MAEYIERGLLKARLPDFKYGLLGLSSGVVRDIVDSAPAADVALVRHGTWKRDMSDEWSSTCFFCSRCKRRVHVPLEADGPEKMYPYCNCGAKMDGGKT